MKLPEYNPLLQLGTKRSFMCPHFQPRKSMHNAARRVDGKECADGPQVTQTTSALPTYLDIFAHQHRDRAGEEGEEKNILEEEGRG